jgi:phosphatidylinositol-3-phosphatase
VKRRWILGTAAAAALAAAALPLFGSSASATGGPSEGVPAFDHVYVLIGENTSLSQLTTKVAPYQLGTLKAQSAWFSDYWGISHYSTSNYIAMTSGQYLPCHQADEKPATCNQTGVANLFGEMNDAGVSWIDWNESMPQPCWLVNAGKNTSSNAYRVKHDPAVYFGEVTSTFTGDQGDAFCQEHVLSTGTTDPNDTSTFDARLKAGTMPQFNLVSPNMCEDGHDNCKPTGTPIKQFDDFLAREVPKIMTSPSFTSNSVIFVVYDEGQDGGPGKAVKFAGGNVPFMVLGDHVHPAVYTQTRNHYSLLRTIEDGLGITTHANNAETASTLGNIWN